MKRKYIGRFKGVSWISSQLPEQKEGLFSLSKYCHTWLQLGFWNQAELQWEPKWDQKSILTNMPDTTHHTHTTHPPSSFYKISPFNPFSVPKNNCAGKNSVTLIEGKIFSLLKEFVPKLLFLLQFCMSSRKFWSQWIRLDPPPHPPTR